MKWVILNKSEAAGHYMKQSGCAMKNRVNGNPSVEVNTEKTKYILLSCHQNAGQNHDTRIVNRSFENVALFEYLGTTVKSLLRRCYKSSTISDSSLSVGSVTSPVLQSTMIQFPETRFYKQVYRFKMRVT
jgi:hypothetical protein